MAPTARMAMPTVLLLCSLLQVGAFGPSVASSGQRHAVGNMSLTLSETQTIEALTVPAADLAGGRFDFMPNAAAFTYRLLLAPSVRDARQGRRARCRGLRGRAGRAVVDHRHRHAQRLAACPAAARHAHHRGHGHAHPPPLQPPPLQPPPLQPPLPS